MQGTNSSAEGVEPPSSAVRPWFLRPVEVSKAAGSAGFIALVAAGLLAGMRPFQLGPLRPYHGWMMVGLLGAGALGGGIGGVLLIRLWRAEEIEWRWGVFGVWIFVAGSFAFVAILLTIMGMTLYR